MGYTSLISRTVSVDVKHHVYLLHVLFSFGKKRRKKRKKKKKKKKKKSAGDLGYYNVGTERGVGCGGRRLGVDSGWLDVSCATEESMSNHKSKLMCGDTFSVLSGQPGLVLHVLRGVCRYVPH